MVRPETASMHVTDPRTDCKTGKPPTLDVVPTGTSTTLVHRQMIRDAAVFCGMMCED